MKVHTLAAFTLGALALGACAGGGGRDRGGPQSDPVRALLSSDALLFADFDADHDYQVTMAEIEAGVSREFARADTNGDGGLGPIEYQTWSNQVLGGGMTPPYRLDFDRNVDNVISPEEFRTELLARAREYDADENGVLTRAEFVREVNRARQPRGPGVRPDIGPDGAGPGGPPPR